MTHTFELDQDVFVLGRGSKANYRIKSEKISRTHAKIEIDDGDFYITDLESSNGVYIGNDKILPSVKTAIDPFSLIKLGSSIRVKFVREKHEQTVSKNTHNETKAGAPDMTYATIAQGPTENNEFPYPKPKQEGLTGIISSSISRIMKKISGEEGPAMSEGNIGAQTRAYQDELKKLQQNKKSTQKRNKILVALGTAIVVLAVTHYLEQKHAKPKFASTPYDKIIKTKKCLSYLESKYCDLSKINFSDNINQGFTYHQTQDQKKLFLTLDITALLYPQGFDKSPGANEILRAKLFLIEKLLNPYVINAMRSENDLNELAVIGFFQFKQQKIVYYTAATTIELLTKIELSKFKMAISNAAKSADISTVKQSIQQVMETSTFQRFD